MHLPSERERVRERVSRVYRETATAEWSGDSSEEGRRRWRRNTDNLRNRKRHIALADYLAGSSAELKN